MADMLRFVPNGIQTRGHRRGEAPELGEATKSLARTWFPERDAALVRLWEDHSLSAAEIGRRLGVGKNAVIGRSHRLQLAPRRSPIARHVTGRTELAPRPMPATLPLETIGRPAEPFAPAQLFTAAPGAMQPDPAQCCWPIGHPGTPTFAFCGAAPRPGKPYCDEHCQRAYRECRTVGADHLDL